MKIASSNMSEARTILEYCKHCGDKQNLEILSESQKDIDWMPDVDETSGDMGPFPYSVFEWKILFCPQCKNPSLIERHAYSEWIEYEEDDEGVTTRTVHWETQILYPRHNHDDLVAKIRDARIRDEVKQAISMLTLEKVDKGLFFLGRAFDVASKEYFIALAKRGKLTSKGKVISQEEAKKYGLSDRIDLLIKNELIEDKKPLDILRQGRNEPGHNIPSLAKRQELMASAFTYATWYIDFILMFEERIADLT